MNYGNVYTPYQPVYSQPQNNYYQPPAVNGYAPSMAQNASPSMPTQSPMSNNSNGILWVQGEEGAKAYMVAPGNSVLLMDSENQSFYIKSTDTSGMPHPLRIFDYTERTAQTNRTVEPINIEDKRDFAERSELETLQAQIAELQSKYEALAATFVDTFDSRNKQNKGKTTPKGEDINA